MKEQIDEISLDLYYLLNSISGLPEGDYKKNLWNKTQEVCEILIYERPNV